MLGFAEASAAFIISKFKVLISKANLNDQEASQNLRLFGLIRGQQSFK